CALGRSAGDDNDVPAATRHHTRPHGAGTQKRAVHVDFLGAPPLLGIGVPHRGIWPGDARVADQDVDWTETLLRLGDRPRHIGGTGIAPAPGERSPASAIY